MYTRTSLLWMGSVCAITVVSPCALAGSGFFENFEDVSTLPAAGWIEINRSSPPGVNGYFQGNPTVFPAHNSPPDFPDTYMGVNFNSGGGGAATTISNWKVSPVLTFENGDVISFWTRTTTLSSFPDRLELRLSQNGTGASVGGSATTVGDFTTLLLSVNPTLTASGYPEVWTLFSTTLSGFTGPTQGRFAFRYFVTEAGPDGANSNYIGIDSLSYIPVGEPTGACCFVDQSCNVLTSPVCDQQGGTYLGNGTSCSKNMCSSSVGACCFTNGTCVDSTQTDCVVQNGQYQGAGTTCNASVCVAKEVVYESFLPDSAVYVPRNDGACWADDIETAAGSEGKRINTIIVQGATDTPAPLADYTVILYKDPDPEFARAPFPNAALEMARCIFFDVGSDPGTLTCILNDPLVDVPLDRQLWVAVCQTDAFDRGGWATGPPAATIGSSDPTVNASSEDFGATWAASGTVEPFNQQCIIIVDSGIGPTGACCLNDGSCFEGFVFDCNDLGGEYQGDVTACEDFDDVCQSGACCFDSGLCQDDVIDTDCTSSGGVFQGYLSGCVQDLCKIGACCTDSGYTCETRLEENCTNAGGIYAGDDTDCTCITDVCDRNCTGDINDNNGDVGDGIVNVDDLLEQIGQWGPCPNPGEGCCTGDIENGGNGTVNVDDLLDLIGQWGCVIPAS